MRKAIHPYKGNKITAAQYIADLGNDRPTMESRPICPICHQRMKLVASKTANSTGHFAHLSQSGFCPSKEPAGVRYDNLPPRRPNAERAIELKRYFINNWKIHFSQLDYFIKGLSKKEFFEVLQLADRARIWEYAHLEPFQIPYILATLMDFPPEKSRNGIDKEKIRKKYFRCFFDSTVQRYDDLWIERPQSLQFWRAWYESTPRKKPRVEELIDAYSIDLNDKFLQYTPKVPQFYVDEIQDWINRRYHMAR